MREKIIADIQQYIRDLDKRQIYDYRSLAFEQRSYSQFAADELLRLLENDNSTPPIMIIEDFVAKMDKYACMSTSNSFIFSVAYDTAIYFLERTLDL